MARHTTHRVTTTRITLREHVAHTKPTLAEIETAREALADAQLDLDTCPSTAWLPSATEAHRAAAAHLRTLESLRYRMSTGYAA